MTSAVEVECKTTLLPRPPFCIRCSSSSILYFFLQSTNSSDNQHILCTPYLTHRSFAYHPYLHKSITIRNFRSTMTNTETPSSEGQSTRRSQKRIAPTNISTTPQSAKSQRNPYPFQSTDGENIDDTMSDYGEDEESTRDTRPHEDRDLLRLAHSFWERRSNDEASPILKVRNVWVYPRPNDGPAKDGHSRYEIQKWR